MKKTSARHIKKMMKEIANERIGEAAAKGGAKAGEKVAEEIAKQQGPSLKGKIAAKVVSGSQKAASVGLAAGTSTAMAAVGLAGHKSEQMIGALKGMDKVIFKAADPEKRLFGREMRKGAFGLFAGGAAVVGVAQGVKEIDQDNMGTRDQNTYRATPTIPSYLDNGGATGDLVFDLYDLRKG